MLTKPPWRPFKFDVDGVELARLYGHLHHGLESVLTHLGQINAHLSWRDEPAVKVHALNELEKIARVMPVWNQAHADYRDARLHALALWRLHAQLDDHDPPLDDDGDNTLRPA